MNRKKLNRRHGVKKDPEVEAAVRKVKKKFNKRSTNATN